MSMSFVARLITGSALAAIAYAASAQQTVKIAYIDPLSGDDDSFDFESASNALRGLIPPNIKVETVERAQLDDASARARL